MRTKTYAEPLLEKVPSSSGAPTTIVSSLIATDAPNLSKAAPSLASNAACCVHVVPLRTKTKAAPAWDPVVES